jgi:hypothetical protein
MLTYDPHRMVRATHTSEISNGAGKRMCELQGPAQIGLTTSNNKQNLTSPVTCKWVFQGNLVFDPNPSKANTNFECRITLGVVWDTGHKPQNMILDMNDRFC